MLNRRQFLERTLKGSSLIALSGLVPQFLANTARSAEVGKDTILVVVELNGGNDGLNTVIPYADDLYYKYRPTLAYRKEQLLRVDDHIGLHPSLRGFDQLLNNGQLAIVQGVGYPNPNRSHFESMDIWQTGDPRGKLTNGWLGRSMGSVKVPQGEIVGMHVGAEQLPLALQGSATGTPTINPAKPYELILDGQRINVNDVKFDQPVTVPPSPPVDVPEKPLPPAPANDKHRAERLRLIREMAELTTGSKNDVLQFVSRSSLQTYTAVERLRQLLRDNQIITNPGQAQLYSDLNLVARIIRAGFGTRIFYVATDGYDTHSNQRPDHERLLANLSNAIQQFFAQLQGFGDDKRVVVMTFSEFGRRVQENGSKGTDHGSGSCLFVAGPAVQGGPIGKHPSLNDLDSGDLRYHTDFRQVYATLLDRWLGCNSQEVLGGKFDHLPLFKGA